MDTLATIFQRFSLHAEVFFAGNLCNLTDFDSQGKKQGHLHLLNAGSLNLIDSHGNANRISSSSILFFPGGKQHRLVPDPATGADLVCANIEYKDPAANPLVHALPNCLIYKFDEFPRLKETAQWLFEEAFSEKSGRLTLIDRLCDILIIQVLREVLDNEKLKSGMLAGMAHKNLAPVINAMHAHPEYAWTLDSMANKAFMSRSRFAEVFKQSIGQNPREYLNNWRMSLVKIALLRGDLVTHIARDVGYENGSALSRAFKKHTGVTPKAWQKEALKNQKG